MKEGNRPQNQQISLQELGPAFFAQALTLKDRDHAASDRRHFLKISTQDLNIVTAERSLGEYVKPQSTFYSYEDGEFRKDSGFSYGGVDFRIASVDMLNVNAEYNPKDSPFSWSLEFREDRSVNLEGTFGAGRIYATYKKDTPRQTDPYCLPRLVSLNFSFDKEKAGEEFNQIYERWEAEGRLPLNEETMRVYDDELKPVFLYRTYSTVDEMMKKGGEEVAIQGQNVLITYNAENSKVELRFLIDGEEQLIAIPFELEEISDLKKKIIVGEATENLHPSLFDRSLPQRVFDTVGFRLPPASVASV